MNISQSGSRVRRTAPWWAGVAAIVMMMLAMIAPQAQAQDVVDTYTVNGVVAADGTLSVKETLTFEGAAPGQFEQRFALTRPTLDSQVFRYGITEVAVTADGKDVPFTQVQKGDYLTVSVDSSAVGETPVTISYQVRGASIALPEVPDRPDRVVVMWRYLQGLSLPVREARGVVTLPNGARTLDVQCVSGPPSSNTSCRVYAAGTFEAPHPMFLDGPRGQGEIVELAFTAMATDVAANDQVEQLWTLDRAFSTDLIPVAVALAALVVGGGSLFLVMRRFGSDVKPGEAARVAEFVPVAAGEEEFRVIEDIRPGVVGTVFDERVDPIDITATIIDLAQRGHLRITELPRQSAYDVRDWQFERRGDDEGLREFELIILNAIAPRDGEPTRVSQINESIMGVVEQIQEAIYQRVADQGWFIERPDQVRRSWARFGLFALIFALMTLVALVAFTQFGLLGLVLVGLAVAVSQVSHVMPRRTARGAAILAGLQMLSYELVSQSTRHVPKASAYEEISRILPYAIVLGGTDRWVQALVEADDDPEVPDPEDLDWYHAPADWQLSDLPASMDAFIATIQGKLFGRN